MKLALIRLFNLKPIHVDEPVVTEEKTIRKQKHGAVVGGTDIGGLGWDYAASQINAQNFGLSQEATVQVAMSWTSPVFLDTVDKYTMISAAPKFNLEILGNMTFGLHLGIVELKAVLNSYPFKFTPLDVMLRADAMQPERYCMGLGYGVKTLLADLMVEARVNECHMGLLGSRTGNDPSDCTWRTYKPELPIYSMQLGNIGTYEDEYMPYRCMNWYSAAWENWPLSEEYIQAH